MGELERSQPVAPVVTRTRIRGAVLLLLAIFAVSIGIGFAPPGGFDWTVAALVLTALGTLALAAVTGYLALSTWQDVRWSQKIAEAATEANRMAAAERERRPDLTLLPDAEKIHCRSEIPDELIVRLLVSNASDRRVATGARVLVDRCISVAGEVVTFGSPALGWTSAAAQNNDEAVVIFAGSSRVLDLGTLIRKGSDVHLLEATLGFEEVRRRGIEEPPEPVEQRPWELRIGLPLVGLLFDRREHVDTGTKIRVVVGSDDGDAKLYDVGVYWMDVAGNTTILLNSLSVTVEEVRS